MKDCIPTDELATLRDLPADHPRRRHVEACARCGAQWALYLDFLTAHPEAGRAEHHARGATRRWWPAPLAMAAVLATLVLLTREPVAPGRAPVTVLRGAPVPTTPELEPARPLPDGTLALRWRAVPDAHGYRVRLLSLAGEVLYESAIQSDTALVLPREALPEPVSAGAAVAWRVFAVTDDGDAMSAPGLIAPRSRPLE